MLTERQQVLYQYLIDKGDKWTVQFQICWDLQNWYGVPTWTASFHDSQARHRLTADIRAINDSEEAEKIILSGGRGCKIANKDEFERHIRKEISASIRRLLRAKRKLKKGNLDGQMKITTNEEEEMIHSFLD